MKKLILIATVIFLGCKINPGKKQEPNIVVWDDSVVMRTGTTTFVLDTTLKKRDTVHIHDTLKIIPNEKELQETLIMYYKAGWTEAINSNIDLYNSGKFTSKKVYDARDLAWRKMENQVRSK